MKKIIAITLLVLALAVLGIIGYVGYQYYFGNHNKQVETNQTTSNATNQSTNANGPMAVPSQTYPVNVYFSKIPDSYDDPSKVFAVSRTSPDLGVGKFSISELLKGPTTAEIDQGYFATARLRDDMSNCGGNDFTLNITNGVATLQFCKPFDHIGSVSDGQAESEIKATLKQFSTVSKVVILNKTGDCEFNLSGLNLCKRQ